jgi:hypothetical protein
MGEPGRIPACLEGGTEALLDGGTPAGSEVSLQLVDPAMLLVRGTSRQFVLLAGSRELPLALLLGLLPVGTGLFVCDPALLPAGREPFLGAGHHPGQAGQRLGFEGLRVGRWQGDGEGAWLKLWHRDLHGGEVHCDGMGKRPGKQLLKGGDAPLKLVVEPSGLLLASLVEEPLLLPLSRPLLRRRHPASTRCPQLSG